MKLRSLVLPAAALAAFACSSSSSRSGFSDVDPVADAGPTDSGGGGFVTEGGVPTDKPGCVPASSNYDIPGDKCDNDGDGEVDNTPTCDSDLTEDGSAESFARALGLCRQASDTSWGIVSAKYRKGYGLGSAPKEQQHGLLPKFGNVVKPREGKLLGVLSTGWAREYNGEGKEPFGGSFCRGPLDCDFNGVWWRSGFGGIDLNAGKLPDGFPVATPGCALDKNVFDTVDVELVIKAPANAKGFSFDFNFYSGEWPGYICARFNDGFIAYLDAKGFNGGEPDNISFDGNGNAVSVNNGFFDRCTPNTTTGCYGAKQVKSVCSGGTSELEGTGFAQVGNWCNSDPNAKDEQSTNGGATGWLTTSAPIQPGETFKLDLIIWDTGDGMLDSSILLDNFVWSPTETKVVTERPR